MFGLRKKTVAGSGTLHDNELGSIEFAVKSNARRLIARWRGEVLHLTIPPGMTALEMSEAIVRLKPRLLAMKSSDRLYEVGKMFDFGDFRVSIISDGHGRADCSVRNPRAGEYEIRVKQGLDLSKPEVEKVISRAMKMIARHIAPVILLPRACEIAEAVGHKPVSWSVSSGRRVLGHCNARGEIAISCMVAFLPPSLRDYIVCHELAHLSEMNHSVAFHRLCDRYCGGNERRLVAALRKFRFPVI